MVGEKGALWLPVLCDDGTYDDAIANDDRLRIVGVATTIAVGVVCVGEIKPAAADSKTSGWKVDNFCSLGEVAGNPNVIVRTLLEGTEEVTACPDGSEDSCKVGRISKVKIFVLVHCTGSNDSPPQFDCTMEALNLLHMEHREVGDLTMFFTHPDVKEYDPESGTLRVGAIYAGIDLAVTGMKPSGDGKWAFGGKPDLLGVGGLMVKSKIQLHGKCQGPPQK